MEAIIVAIINGLFAVILYFLKTGRIGRRKRMAEAAGATAQSKREPVANQRPWMILGIVFWILIGVLVLIGGSDLLLNTILVIPVVSIGFTAIWPTSRFRAAGLVALAFAVSAAAQMIAELIKTGARGGLTFSRTPSLLPLWLSVSVVTVVVVWIISELRLKKV